MRALFIAVLAASPSLVRAQGTQAISQNPASTQVGRPVREPMRDARERDARDGERHHGRPRVIVVSPYDMYGTRFDSRFDGRYDDVHFGSLNTTYVGRYGLGAAALAPLAPLAPVAPDTTIVRYVPIEPAARDEEIRIMTASPAAISLAVERVGGSMLRLRWTGRDPSVRAVTLVVADASRRVIAAQTLRLAPYSAVFDNGGRVAFVGTTLRRADGTSTTTLVPVGRVAAPGPRPALPPIRRTPG